MIFIAQPTERVDLQRVVIHGRVLEQPIVRIEHFFGQQIEPLPRQTAIVQPGLAFELNPQFGLEQFRFGDGVDDTVRVLQDRHPSDLDFDLVGDVGLQLVEHKLLDWM